MLNIITIGQGKALGRNRDTFFTDEMSDDRPKPERNLALRGQQMFFRTKFRLFNVNLY